MMNIDLVTLLPTFTVNRRAPVVVGVVSHSRVATGGRGETGRHPALRTQGLRACGFESRRAYGASVVIVPHPLIAIYLWCVRSAGMRQLPRETGISPGLFFFVLRGFRCCRGRMRKCGPGGPRGLILPCSRLSAFCDPLPVARCPLPVTRYPLPLVRLSDCPIVRLPAIRVTLPAARQMRHPAARRR